MNLSPMICRGVVSGRHRLAGFADRPQAVKTGVKALAGMPELEAKSRRDHWLESDAVFPGPGRSGTALVTVIGLQSRSSTLERLNLERTAAAGIRPTANHRRRTGRSR